MEEHTLEGLTLVPTGLALLSQSAFAHLPVASQLSPTLNLAHSALSHRPSRGWTPGFSYLLQCLTQNLFEWKSRRGREVGPSFSFTLREGPYHETSDSSIFEVDLYNIGPGFCPNRCLRVNRRRVRVSTVLAVFSIEVVL